MAPGGVAMPKWYADNAPVPFGTVFMTRMRGKIHGLRGGASMVLIAALAGCATVPPPIQLMDRAQSEIRMARNAGAAMSAPDVLAEAERRLAAAQQFSTNGDNGKATDAAAEAEAAAATAQARAEAARLGQQIRQQTRVNDDLQADLERRQAAAAAAQQAAAAPPPAPAAASSSGLPAEPGSAAPPAPSDNGPVTLPPIELGQPAPASGASSGQPTPGFSP